MCLAWEAKSEEPVENHEYQKGVSYLCQKYGIVPSRYVLSVVDRPSLAKEGVQKSNRSATLDLQLPIIDFSELHGSKRPQVLKLLMEACEEFGFFQVINHGIPQESLHNLMDAGRNFFQLPFDDKAKYMSGDLHSSVRYGTSFNQNKDDVLYWRDFLKLTCHPNPSSDDVPPSWPSSPLELRPAVMSHSKQTKFLFLKLMEAILETLVGNTEYKENDNEVIMKEFENGSQLMFINFYPPCPEPDLTLGIPPHSDYGFLTLLLHDNGAQGLQIQYQGEWITIHPQPNSLIVNIGDFLEIFSNGRYKSVLHRAFVNSTRARISVASFHSLPVSSMVRPWPKLINESNPRKYKDTDFALFLTYASSCEPKKKSFLESRKLNTWKLTEV